MSLTTASNYGFYTWPVSQQSAPFSSWKIIFWFDKHCMRTSGRYSNGIQKNCFPTRHHTWLVWNEFSWWSTRRGGTSPLCVSLVNCPTSAREQRAASFSWWNLPNGANLLPLPSSCLFLCYLFITWQTLLLFIRSKMTTWPRFCETLVARWNCSSPGMSSRTTTFPLPHSVRTAWTTRCVCVCVCVRAWAYA